jgi:hypothetical protein
LIAKIRALGAGEFVDDGRFLPHSRKAGGKVIMFDFSLRYVFSDDQMMIRIHYSFRHVEGGWRRFHYAHHCGPSPLDEKDTHFRIDLDDIHHEHVHLSTYPGDHIPVQEIDPPVANVTPFAFLTLVEAFRRTKSLPLTRKP